VGSIFSIYEMEVERMSRPSVIVRSMAKVVVIMAVCAFAAGAAFASAANSVINLGGIGYVYGDTTSMPQAVNGAYTGPDYTQYFINTPDTYPNQGDEPGNAIAVQSALDLIHQIRSEDPNNPKPIFFKTSSNGGDITTEVVKQMVANGESTNNIYMVMAVNPSSGTNGYKERFPSSMNAFMTALRGGNPTQAVGGVKILSIGRQYDLISDSPVYWFNPIADMNAVMGFFLVHPFVYKMNLSDPRNYVTTDGNLTQVIVYTDKLPITMPLRAIVPGPIVDAIDRVLRPIIETAYIRPDASDPNNPANNPNNVILGSFAPDPSKWLGVVQRLITGELQAFGLAPTPPNSTGTVQLPGPTVPTAAIVPVTTPMPLAATPEAKVSQPAQSSSPKVQSSMSLTATQPQAQTSPEKPAASDKDSDTPVSSPSVTSSATQPSVTHDTTPSGSPETGAQQSGQKDQKQDNPKDTLDSPKVKTPKKGDHPKGSTDSESDVPKSGSTVSKHDTKKGDKDSSPDSKPASDDTSTSPKPQDRPSHKTGDSDSKAPAHAASGGDHS
jgi:hypothetical protein